jgi:hypothetical protein
MALVASQTSIPLPRLHKHLLWDGSLWLFMDYIDGDDLETVWSSLGLWTKLKVAWALRGYVKQLRRVQIPNHNVPGPIDGSGRPLPCIGRYFSDNQAGPFTSYSQMSSWFASKRRITMRLEQEIAAHRNEKYKPSIPLFDDSAPLVLTHADISLRNVILDHNGTVWLLDWGQSGAYPKWFEYAGIMAYEDRKETPRTWLWLAPLIAGWYRSQYSFLQEIRAALVYWGLEES